MRFYIYHIAPRHLGYGAHEWDVSRCACVTAEPENVQTSERFKQLLDKHATYRRDVRDSTPFSDTTFDEHRLRFSHRTHFQSHTHSQTPARLAIICAHLISNSANASSLCARRRIAHGSKITGALYSCMLLSPHLYTLHTIKQVFDLCIRKRVRMQVVHTCVFCVCVCVVFSFFHLLR